MATVVNNPPPTQPNNSSNITSLVLLIFILILGILLIYYGIPYLRSFAGGGASAPQINVPQNVNVNIYKK